MTVDAMTFQGKIRLMAYVVIAAVVGLFMYGPIPQDLGYHNFIDKRPLLGIPNFGDVIGNVAFLLAGIWGLYRTHDFKIYLPHVYHLWMVFYVGVFLTGLGSGWYHLNPSNDSLFWGRLPMTISFAAFFCIVMAERISVQKAVKIFPALLVLCMATVPYWIWSEHAGHGDLRPYAVAQFLPMLLVPMMLWLFPVKKGGERFLVQGYVFYVLAKFFEHYDVAIFNLTSQSISGHTIKHVMAALGALCMARYMRRWPQQGLPA